MNLHILKIIFSLVVTTVFLGSLVTILMWYMVDSHVETPRLPPHKKSVPVSSDQCKDCRDVVDKAIQRYAKPWKRQEQNYQKFSSLLSSKCHGAEDAVVTQNNTPLGSDIVYNGETKKKITVTADLLSTFPKEHPFPQKKFDTCSVVGNGGILIDSGCGQQIDSAQFVIRCNLPPFEGVLEKHVGKKTDLVTANPSILIEKFHALNHHRRPFVESLSRFEDSVLLLPTFSFGYNTPVCLRAVYAIEDFNSKIRPVSFNPKYLQTLHAYWRSNGLREARLSTGFMMVSLALEMCNSVNLYGFWPFGLHPADLRPLTNHYYDNRPPRKKFHSMPAEFDHLLKLHSDGVLRIHLGDCGAAKDKAEKTTSRVPH